jgi:predicted ATPase
MHIREIELRHFRNFSNLHLTDIPQNVILVAKNGAGKSSILEAIAAVKEFVATYNTGNQRFRGQEWPPHLRSPVKIGATECSLSIVVQPSPSERAKLQIPHDALGTARVRLNAAGHLIDMHANQVIQSLFSYHAPEDGIGYLDYYRPVRWFPKTSANFSWRALHDSAIRESLDEIGRGPHEQVKFNETKQYVINAFLDDYIHFAETGTARDSLAELRATVNDVLYPKQFLGFRPITSTEAVVAVRTPWGDHDVDLLSEGEREMFFALARMHRFRSLPSVVLWDTPEAHINPAAQSVLYSRMRRISPLTQFWLATHSQDIIESVNPSDLFILQWDQGECRVSRGSQDPLATRLSAMSALGARAGLHTVSRLTLFIEGEGSAPDKRAVERLVVSGIAGVNTVLGGNKETLLQVGARANRLLQSCVTGSDFLALLDRDYRDETELSRIENEYRGCIAFWRVHELENIFVDSVVIHRVLQIMGRGHVAPTVEDVEMLLRTSAEQLCEWVAADWVASEVDGARQSFRRRISHADPSNSLRETVLAARTTFGYPSQEELDARLASKLAVLRGWIDTGEWKARFPGKELLDRFLGQSSLGLQRALFIDTAGETIARERIPVPEADRIRALLRNRLGDVEVATH